MVERDPDALVTALEEHSDLGRLPFSVEGIDTIFLDGRVIAVVDGPDLDDMPDESVTLLKSGKASFKALASGKRLEMHRDAICSAALRAVNLGRTDAQALIERLGGHMSWGRRDGFRAINAAAFGIDLSS